MQGGDRRLGRLAAAELHEGAALAGAVRAPVQIENGVNEFMFFMTLYVIRMSPLPEYCALLDSSEGREELPDVLLELTLAQHPDKQLPVIPHPALNLHRLARPGHQLVHLEQRGLVIC